jgi:hypothetical protein
MPLSMNAKECCSGDPFASVGLDADSVDRFGKDFRSSRIRSVYQLSLRSRPRFKTVRLPKGPVSSPAR